VLGAPPLPQPLNRSVVGRRRRSAQRMGRMVLVARVFRMFQKQRRAVGSRRGRILSGALFGGRFLWGGAGRRKRRVPTPGAVGGTMSGAVAAELVMVRAPGRSPRVVGVTVTVMRQL